MSEPARLRKVALSSRIAAARLRHRDGCVLRVCKRASNVPVLRGIGRPGRRGFLALGPIIGVVLTRFLSFGPRGQSITPGAEREMWPFPRVVLESRFRRQRRPDRRADRVGRFFAQDRTVIYRGASFRANWRRDDQGKPSTSA